MLQVHGKGWFAIQRVYTDDRALNETLAVNNGEVVLVPRGYNPLGLLQGMTCIISTWWPARPEFGSSATIRIMIGWCSRN